jgi:hypothetical protein
VTEQQLHHPNQPNERRGIAPIACDEVRDLIPAMALNAIETGSAHLIRLHCESCPPCAHDLAESEIVARWLPFSAPTVAPPAGAKLALMARIAAPAPVLAVADTRLNSPIVQSPAEKRRSSQVETSRSSDLLDWTRDLVTARSLKFAAAPLALVLVLASVYGFGGFDQTGDSNPSIDVGQVVPQVSNAVESAAEAVDPLDTADDVSVSFLSQSTSGATATQPVVVSNGTMNSTFMARSSRSGTQTELMRSIAPRFAECAFAKGEDGVWHIEVSGVNLPNLDGPADVYLISHDGETIDVGGVTLDESGNGIVSIDIDEPLSDYRTMQIGVDATADTNATFISFNLDLADRLSLGLGKSG